MFLEAIKADSAEEIFSSGSPFVFDCQSQEGIVGERWLYSWLISYTLILGVCYWKYRWTSYLVHYGCSHNL